MIYKRLTEAIERSGKTRLKIAEEAGISREYLWKLEKGLVKSPTVEVAKNLCRVLNISIITFM